MPFETAHPLRQRAEAILAQRSGPNRRIEASTLRLNHELQVHQIELEMQDEALRQTQADIDDARQRAATAAELAGVADRAKEAFLSTMTHELRTPLHQVLGALDLARWQSTNAEQIKWLDRCSAAAKTLQRLIDDVLDLTQLKANRLSLDRAEFTLDLMLQGVLDTLGPRAAAKSIGLDLEVSTQLAQQPLIGDSARLSQVLYNLASNAIKFSSEGSVTVRVTSIEETDLSVLMRFDIIDTGIGISADDCKRLFRDFEQLDSSSTRAFGGSGIGLAIARYLVLMMGGKISVHSTPGRGSTFWFAVRLDKGPAPAAT